MDYRNSLFAVAALALVLSTAANAATVETVVVTASPPDPVGNDAFSVTRLTADDLNLEFAYKGTGTFNDLKNYPKERGIGVGSVDVRLPKIPKPAEIVKLLDGVLKHVSAKQVLLNPDCGFAPHHGEPPQVDEAFNKLKALADAARLLRLRAGGKNIRSLLRDREHGPVSHRYHLRTEE